MSSTLFLVSLDNTESQVIQQLVHSVHKLRAKDDGFVQTQKELVQNGKWSDFLANILGSTEALLTAPKAYAVSYYTIAFDFLSRVTPAERKTLVVNVCADLVDPKIKFTGGGGDGPTLRIQLLADLYNLRCLKTEYSVRCNVLCSLIAYAAQTSNLQYLSMFLSNIEKILKQWGVSVEDTRKLYKLLGEVLPSQDAQRFRIEFLKTFNGSTAAEIASVKDQARKAIVGVFEASLTRSCSSLFELEAIQQLQKDSDAVNVKLYNLLEIFARGNLADYKAFYAANKDVVTDSGIDNDRALDSMRLLTLHNLAQNQKDNKLKYKTIADALQIDIDDVESWVITAMSKKQQLIDARMDQSCEIVMINSCIQRNFEQKQWVALQAKLHAWKANLTKHLQQRA